MDALRLDPATTALVLIDLQNGIMSRPLAPHSADDVIDRANKLANALRARGGMIVYVRVLLSEVFALPADVPSRDPNAPPPPPEASELVSALARQEKDAVVAKRSWGAFYGTQLEQILRRRGIKTIVLGGIATNIGVESTARAAYDRAYEIVFVEDAMSTMSVEAHEFATKTIFPRMGRVRRTADVLEALAQ